MSALPRASPFDVRIESHDEALSADVARKLRDALATRGIAHARVLAERPLALADARGLRALVRVRDVAGQAAWLPPVRVRDDPDCAARDVLSFLERWGFIHAHAAPTALPTRAREA